LFGVSFELGAFFAGMMMGESKLAHDAAEETLPLRDAFAVLFFVSIGMLFNFRVVLTEPLVVLAALAIIVLGKSLAALLIVLASRRPLRTALTIAVSLAQIGEFSFILIGVGVAQQMVSKEAQDVLLAAAIVSILLNPLLFKLFDRAKPWLDAREAARAAMEAVPVAIDEPVPEQADDLAGHVVVVGHGRVGSLICGELRRRGCALLVMEMEPGRIEALRAQGIRTISGHAARDEALAAANLGAARALLVTAPDAFEAGEIVRVARRINPRLPIYALAGSGAAATHLREQGADLVVSGEHEMARGMLDRLSVDGATPATAA
jgi:CPA2 family monovalent cation:H+ antiporter-2